MNLSTRAVLVSAAASAAFSGVAAAQTGWIFDIDYGPGHTSVNPDNPSCSVTVVAFFSPVDHAFAGSRWNIDAAEGAWSGVYVEDFGSIIEPGPFVVGSTIFNCITGQIHLPPRFNANPANPVRLLWGEWSTQDFARRDVDLWTLTARFDVYPDPNSSSSQTRLSSLTEGRAVIRVTPTPGSLMVALAGVLAFAQRRRR
jgi:MYXO-CTERM domain-containing protein